MKKIFALMLAMLMLVMVPLSVSADGLPVGDNVGTWETDTNNQIWSYTKGEDGDVYVLGNSDNFTVSTRVKIWGDNQIAIVICGKDVNGDGKITDSGKDAYILLWMGTEREISAWIYKDGTYVSEAIGALPTGANAGVVDIMVKYKDGVAEMFAKPMAGEDIDAHGHDKVVRDDLAPIGKFNIPEDARFGSVVALWVKTPDAGAWFSHPEFTDTTPTDPVDPTDPADPVDPVDPVAPKTGDATAVGLFCSALCLAAVSVVVSKKRHQD